MEKKLAEDDAAQLRETEIKLPVAPRRKSGKVNNPRAIKSQTMGNCERCGYISSQKICKACMLLDGLNKNRPKTAIEVAVGIEEEESSSTLMRQMERVQLTTG